MSQLAKLEDLNNKQLHAECLRYGLPNVPVTDSNRNVLIKRLLGAIGNAAGNDLEQLSNKALRAECLKWGLPNVPVTDSSRSVLIRKLRAAMANGSFSNNNKSTRSTIHQENNNNNKSTRSTIHQENNNNNNNSTRSTIHQENNNKFTRSTIHQENNNSFRQEQLLKEKRQSVTKPSISSISPLVLDSSLESLKSPSQSFRRSPSLSKSGVVTTSYTQEVKSLPRHIEYEDDMDTYEENEPEISYVDLDELPESPVSTSPYRTSLYNNNYSYDQTRTSSPLVTNFARDSNMNSGHQPLHSVTGRPSFAAPLKRSTTYTTSTEAPVVPKSYVPPRQVSFAAPTMRSSNLAPKLYPNLNNFYATQNALDPNRVVLEDDLSEQEDDSTEQIEISSDEEAAAHYASTFTRSFEHGNNNNAQQTYMRHSRMSNNTSSPLPSALARRPIPRNDDVMTSLHNFLQTLEQRYHLKQAFAFILAFIFAVFIYVFFLQ